MLSPAQLYERQLKLNLTGKQMAMALGVAVGTYSRWTNGKQPMPADLYKRLDAITPAQGLPPMGRPKKATYALLCQNGMYTFYFDDAGNPLSAESKIDLAPGETFWLARSPGTVYDGSPQHQHERSTIPGHRQDSHPLGVWRTAPK